MNQYIEIAVNAWYQAYERVGIHYSQLSFDEQLLEKLPNLVFTYCTHTNTYILIGER